MVGIDSLNRNTDFRRLYGRGKSVVSPILVTYALPNKTDCCRVGITTSKKIGNAVTRNRARRVIRAAYIDILPRISQGYDIVFVARGRTAFKKSTEIAAVMTQQLYELGIIKAQTGEVQ